MKKIFTIMIVAMFASAAFAQIPEQLKQGKILIETNATNVGITFTNGVNMNIGASGGYFVIDKLSIGGNIGLGVTSFEQTNEFGQTSTDSNTSFRLGAGARYYFLSNEKGGLFATGVLNITVGGNETVFGVGFNGGYSFFINKYISIEPLLMLDLPFAKGSDVTFGVGAGISIYL